MNNPRNANTALGIPIANAIFPSVVRRSLVRSGSEVGVAVIVNVDGVNVNVGASVIENVVVGVEVDIVLELSCVVIEEI
jgi:hypothetical protein